MSEPLVTQNGSDTLTISKQRDCVAVVHRRWCNHKCKYETTAFPLSVAAFHSLFAAVVETVQEERSVK